MTTKHRGIIVAIALFAAAGSCKDKGGSKPAKPPPAAEDAAPFDAAVKRGFSGQHRAHEDNKDWTPAEYKRGAGRWRDAGVYVDGKQVGVLWYGELPTTLEPIWLDDIQMLEFKAGDKGPREKKIKVKRYRLVDYLEKLGVNVGKVKALHIYGGKGFASVTSGAQMRKFRDELHFAFGRETSGKPLIYLPAKMKISTSFDHIAAVAVYIDKKPPTLRDDGELVLDGEVVTDIPYFGEPVRGGVRVYVDDRYGTTIKRRTLEGSDEINYEGPDGNLRWRLFPFLESRDIATDAIAGGIVIYQEQEIARLTREQLADTYFTANPQSSGKVLLGDDALRMQALLLFTKQPLPPKRNEVPPPIEED